MSKLQWREPGTRFFRRGVDRGVLYVPEEDGVAWSGLISVDERPNGGVPTPHYVDGYKYLNLSSFEEYEATLTAFYSPVEFDKCDGTVEVFPGMQATNQARRPFGLSYRTGLGNDLNPRRGYQIHLVYNALAAPSAIANRTESDDNNVAPLAWNLTTQPIFVEGASPTSHFIVDTTKAPTWFVTQIEYMLYGQEGMPALLPHPDELRELEPGKYGEALYDISFYN